MKYLFDPIRLTKRSTQIVRCRQQSVRTQPYSTSRIGLRAKPAPSSSSFCMARSLAWYHLARCFLHRAVYDGLISRFL